MTVRVTRNDKVVEDFSRSADYYVEHFDGPLEVIRGGTAPPERFPDGKQQGGGHLRDLINRLAKTSAHKREVRESRNG